MTGLTGSQSNFSLFCKVIASDIEAKAPAIIRVFRTQPNDVPSCPNGASDGYVGCYP